MFYIVLQENPGMDFTKVSQKLAKSWGSLSEEEKERYKRLANERKKGVVANKANDIQPLKKPFQFCFKNLRRHSTLINVELSEIKKMIFERPKAM